MLIHSCVLICTDETLNTHVRIIIITIQACFDDYMRYTVCHSRALTVFNVFAENQ